MGNRTYDNKSEPCQSLVYVSVGHKILIVMMKIKLVVTGHCIVEQAISVSFTEMKEGAAPMLSTS